MQEDQRAPWYPELRRYNLGSTMPVLRLMIQQSNCFVIVESGGALTGGLAGGGGGYSNTPQGKVVTAAFADSYNQMVTALKSYKAQTVKGGLGTGGRLGVSGGTTEASKEVGGATAAAVETKAPAATAEAKPAAKPAAKPVPKKPVKAETPKTN